MAVQTGQEPTPSVPHFWRNATGGAFHWRVMWQSHDGAWDMVEPKWDMVPPTWNQRLTIMWDNTPDFEIATERFESREGNCGTLHQWEVSIPRYESTDGGEPPSGSAKKTNKPWLDDRHLRMVTVFRTANSYAGAEAVPFPHEAELVWQYGIAGSWQNFDPSASQVLNTARANGQPHISWVHKYRHPKTQEQRSTKYTANFTDLTQTSGDYDNTVRPIRLVAIASGDFRPYPE